MRAGLRPYTPGRPTYRLAEILHQERHGRERTKPLQIGHRGNFSPFDRVLITALYQRGVIWVYPLGEIYQCDATNVSRLKNQTKRLFELYDVHINPLPNIARARTLDELRTLAHNLTNTKIQPTS